MFDAARNFVAGVPAAAGMRHIGDIISDIQAGKSFPPLIAAEDPDGSLILIEGHSRATGCIGSAGAADRSELPPRYGCSLPP